MKISNLLRQECMPEMVYILCKTAFRNKGTKTKLKDYLTLNDGQEVSSNQSWNQFKFVFNFCLDSGFIFEDENLNVIANFDEKDLKNFRSFRYKIFLEINNTFKKEREELLKVKDQRRDELSKEEKTEFNSVFMDLAEWYLKMDTSVFSISKPEDFNINIPEEIYNNTMKKFNDSENKSGSEGSKELSKDYVLGFYFWIEVMGLAHINDVAKKGRKTYFAVYEILKDWIEFSKPFPRGKSVVVREFIEVLVNKLPIFKSSFENSKQQIIFSMSSALRILDEVGYIELIYTKDSGENWQLHLSKVYQKNNFITEIKVK